MALNLRNIIFACCLLMLLPLHAAANHVNLNGLVFVFAAAILLATVFIINIVMFLVNIRKRKTGRALKVIVLSAIMLPLSIYIMIFQGVEMPSEGLTRTALVVAILHLVMLGMSVKIIKQNKRQKGV